MSLMKTTLENLTKAFIGESQARNRYTFYSKLAKKEGQEKIAEIFLITADNEREHAKWLFRMIRDLQKKVKTPFETITVTAEAPTTLGNTVENLKAAIEGEHYENVTMYPEFAAAAEKDGLPKIAERLRAIGHAEEHHEERFKALLELVESGKILKRDEEVSWVCSKCGYVHKGKEPLAVCPSCSHPARYFELKCESY